MYDKLINDYLNKVTKDMGQKQRDDVRNELRSHILDSADALAAERNTTVDDSIVREVITRMGSPEKMAEGYPLKKGGILRDRFVLVIGGIIAIILLLGVIATMAGICTYISLSPISEFGGSGVVEHRQDTTSHAGAGKINLDISTIGGDVRIAESPNDSVEVTFDVRASQGHLSEVLTDTTYVLDGDTLKVKAEAKYANPHKPFIGTRAADVVVKVPKGSQYNLNLETAGGDIIVIPLNGSGMTLNTMGGDIEVAGGSYADEITASTAGGKIEVTSLNSDSMTLDTMGGDVIVNEGKYHTIKLTTAGGKIEADYEAVKATFDTMGGRISLNTTQTTGDITASTAGGDISVALPKDTKFSADASTFGGKITHRYIPMVLSQDDPRDLEGYTEGGAGSLNLKLDTMGGDISISYS